MFEDSSSDSDEDEESAPCNKKDGNNIDLGDEDQLSQIDGGNDNETGTESEKRKLAVGLFDDSSDDEDDAVFDDAGAVIGSTAPIATNHVVGDAVKSDVVEQINSNHNVKSKKSGGNRPPQNLTVLHVDRPESEISLHMTKLPNVVAIQPTAFNVDRYDENHEEQEYKGYVHNMVRWRYKRDENDCLVRDEDGSLVRESNSKLVKWSDGSFTLHIGKEAFDIQDVVSCSNDGFTGLNGYVYQSQKAAFHKENVNDVDKKEKEAQDGGTVLECIGPITSRLVAKPSSLQSEAHKSLTVAVRQRTIKKAKIASYMTEEDPERLKQERIKYNTDADKIKQRKKTTGSGCKHRSPGYRRNPSMNRGYLEASDDEGYDTVNLRALKKGSDYDVDAMDDYGEDSEDDYDQSFVNRNHKRQRKATNEESEEEEEMVFDEEDEEVVNVHKKNKQSHVAVLDDDE